MCALVKDKSTEFFQPLQLGVACRAGAEKVAHALRGCTGEHWMDEDFVVLKVDMRNVLDECATFFPQSCYLGCLGVMGPILCYGTLLVRSALSLECSRVTL